MVANPIPGDIVGGRYRLGTVVGTGGSGTVWQAHDQLLDRAVAIKELRLSPHVTDEQRVAHTAQAMVEARTTARLHHPGIVTVFDVVDDGIRPWIVMQYVDGRSLEQAVHEDGAWAPERAARLAAEILVALATAHAAGIIHRDVKPSNVLVPNSGGAMLTDFSIARQIGAGTLANTGVVMGSPGYIAPERITNGQVAPSADLFGLGATLFFAVEGHGPFDADDAMASAFAAAIRPHPRAEHAGALIDVIDGLLVKDPRHRLTIEQALEMLGEILAAEAVQPSAAAPPQAAPRGAVLPGAVLPEAVLPEVSAPAAIAPEVAADAADSPDDGTDRSRWTPAEAEAEPTEPDEDDGTAGPATATFAAVEPTPEPPAVYDLWPVPPLRSPDPDPTEGGTPTRRGRRGRILASAVLVILVIVGAVVFGQALSSHNVADASHTTAASSTPVVAVPSATSTPVVEPSLPPPSPTPSPTPAPTVTSISVSVAIGAAPGCVGTITATVHVTGPVTVRVSANATDSANTHTGTVREWTFHGTGRQLHTMTLGTVSGVRNGTVTVHSTAPNTRYTTRQWIAPAACLPGFAVGSPTVNQICPGNMITGSIAIHAYRNSAPVTYTARLFIDGVEQWNGQQTVSPDSTYTFTSQAIPLSAGSHPYYFLVNTLPTSGSDRQSPNGNGSPCGP